MRRLLAPLCLTLACTAPKETPGPAVEAGVRTLTASPPAEVVVVGGGLAGLVTAYQLGKSGVRVHLLEAAELFGGRVQTAHYGPDLHAEFGMQEMWEGNPLIGIARELGVALDGAPEEPFSSVLIDGKVAAYVHESSEAFFATLFDKEELKAQKAWLKSAQALRAEALSQGLSSAKVRELQGISFAVWMQSLKLPKRVTDWVKLTLECELATTWDGFSALDGLLEMGIFLGGGVPNYHVKGGNSRLIEALAAAIKGDKTLSALVQGVRRTSDAGGKTKLEVRYLKDRQVHVLEAERVVLAVPFFRLHQINFEPPLSEERWRSVQSLGLGQYTVVHLIMDKQAGALWNVGDKSPFPVLTDGPLGVIYGVQEETPATQPNQVFALLIYGLHARFFHMVPRETKLAQVIGELDRLWPGFKDHVKESHVYTYHPASLAVFPPGRSPLDEAAALLRRPEGGIYFAGDYTRGSHSDHAAESGVEVAEAITAELRPR